MMEEEAALRLRAKEMEKAEVNPKRPWTED